MLAKISVREAKLNVGRHDPVKQLLYESHVHLSNAGVRVYPIVTRYAWPAELDLMARPAGGQGVRTISARACPMRYTP